MTEYQAVIGMEVHAQLRTDSKMFCGCGAGYCYAPPNTHVCPVCLGMPGVLPVINGQAVEILAHGAGAELRDRQFQHVRPQELLLSRSA